MSFIGIGLGVASRRAGVVYLLRDTFTDSNGTSLDAHIMNVGGGWSENNGAWIISNNGAVADGAHPGAPAYVTSADAGVADVLAEVTINFPSASDWAALVFRYASNTSFNSLVLRYDLQEIQLFTVSGGVFSQQARYPKRVDVGADYHIAVYASGSDVRAYQSGAEIMRLTLTNAQTATRHGLRATATISRFDNFSVVASAMPDKSYSTATLADMQLIGNGLSSAVIEPSASGSDSGGIREIGNVLYEPSDTGKEYKIWYTGYNAGVTTDEKVHYAYSSDGISWTKSASNPVISARAEDPYVVKSGSTYYLFAEDKAGGATDIKRWDSADGVTWANETTVLQPGTAGEWDDADVSSPTVWIEGGTWYMLYEGRGTGNAHGRVGLATSADGATWTREASNPVFDENGSFAQAGVVPDDIIKIESVYYLFYHGYTLADTSWRAGMATSADLLSWTDHKHNPLNSADTSTYNKILTGPMIVNDGSLKFFFADSDDSGVYYGRPVKLT